MTRMSANGCETALPESELELRTIRPLGGNLQIAPTISRSGQVALPPTRYKLAMIASRVTLLCWATVRRIVNERSEPEGVVIPEWRSAGEPVLRSPGRCGYQPDAPWCIAIGDTGYRRDACPRCREGSSCRSEEHTSELQSLRHL